LCYGDWGVEMRFCEGGWGTGRGGGMRSVVDALWLVISVDIQYSIFNI